MPVSLSGRVLVGLIIFSELPESREEVGVDLGLQRVKRDLHQGGLHQHIVSRPLARWGTKTDLTCFSAYRAVRCICRMNGLEKALTPLQAIPLFVTSLLVPFLVVVLRVARSDSAPHQRLPSKQAASYVFAAMWTPVIMLLLGGFTIAAALSKYNIAKMMATFVLSKAGTKPRTVLLTSMGVAMFASMWISNVAAPVLCFSIIQVRATIPPFNSYHAKLATHVLDSNSC